MVFVAADREGRARAAVVPDGTGATLGTKVAGWSDPDTPWLMTNCNSAYAAVSRQMQGHSAVIHRRGQHTDPITGAHANTPEALISSLRRALV